MENENFIDDYLKGRHWATPKQFIEAKEVQYQTEHNTPVVRFDYSLLNAFYDRLKDISTPEDGEHNVAYLLDAWTYAEQEVEDNAA